MKIDYNGIVRDMTPEEEEALEIGEDYEPEEEIKTDTQRITELEDAFNLLLSGGTE